MKKEIKEILAKNYNLTEYSEPNYNPEKFYELHKLLCESSQEVLTEVKDEVNAFFLGKDNCYLMIISLTELFTLLNHSRETGPNNNLLNVLNHYSEKIDFINLRAKITLEIAFKEKKEFILVSEEELNKINLILRFQCGIASISLGGYFLGEEILDDQDENFMDDQDEEEMLLSIIMEDNDYVYSIDAEPLDDEGFTYGYVCCLNKIEKIKNLNSSIDELLKNIK